VTISKGAFLRTVKSAVFAALLLFPIANGCQSTSHDFGELGGGGGGGETGLAGSTTGGGAAGKGMAGSMTAQAGSMPVETGGAAPAGGAPMDDAGADAGGMGGAGGDPGPVGECKLGDQESCWAAADGTPLAGTIPTLEKGSCHIGKRFCGEDLNWGPCLGAVGPKASDSCDVAGNDDDCDGTPNEDCACVDGTERACGTDVGSCVAGKQKCVAQAWGACIGEVTKQTLDSCATAGNDDNCNGTPNDDCACIGNASENCNDCGTHECNPVARQWGACHNAKGPKACGCGTMACQSDGTYGSCQPAASECTSSTQIRDCTVPGGWVTSTCKYACVNDQCGGSCVPGDGRCLTAPERRQSCSDQGVWTTVETCSGNKLCQDDGASCVAPCAGQKLCPGNVCAPLGGCCSDSDCSNNFACLNGTCSTDTCQLGFNGPCGGVCTKGCCSVVDCPNHPNMGRSCDTNAHQCLYSCKQNFGNCDGSDTNGCEVDLSVGTPAGTTVKYCGSCNITCDFTNHGAAECTTLYNTCSQADCQATFKPVGDPSDAGAYKCPVHLPHGALHYGDCDVGCSYDCDPGYAECNSYESDGCETQTNSPDPSCTTTPFWGGTPP
jgi:hypothetical protein